MISIVTQKQDTQALGSAITYLRPDMSMTIRLARRLKKFSTTASYSGLIDAPSDGIMDRLQEHIKPQVDRLIEQLKKTETHPARSLGDLDQLPDEILRLLILEHGSYELCYFVKPRKHKFL